ncbi:DoxX family protein [Vibrio diazotrophicus]|uniref:DoxX family protein n=1 Tax=Vibrio diazotrophicus TaxID=685 RepID=UPI00142D6A9C|nr:DoxX family protein [Vibrio diazotrophicus]NIY93214.1 DoxX family protein [Vibrio diazotrophicus]
MISAIARLNLSIEWFESRLAPIVLLISRIWVSWVFFNSGLTKITTWSSTLYLFEWEYQVPFISWKVAAYLATAAELVIPIFLLLGLFGRLSAAALFAVNITAVISYPLLWERGFYDHQLWGMMMLTVMIWGPGSLSIDRWINRKSFTVTAHHEH